MDTLHRSDPDTRTAALSATAPRISVAHDIILMALFDCKEVGMTADEVAEYCGYKQLFTRPRMSELVAAGLIEKTGERRVNASGMSAAVWRLKA